MITSYRHKGLREFARSGTRAGISPALAERIHESLSALAKADSIAVIEANGLHPMTKGSPLAGTWALKVSGSWRITFCIAENGNFYNLDLINYH